ncbi:hypothetical protein A9Q84_14475 [Halobacteriovorax marinus]|uniref:Uncharacterized protein n=1 Tax=Halobacteriovorax marinus TaxID=97084 RepID=A0A1Y5FAB9_9BACT|nr:hypothetical protein A9Q84_14475 [Halobacteriovorax marinus]
MNIREIAKSKKITQKKLNSIAKEFDENITNLTKNNAHLFLLQTLEQMNIYADLYVYEGRYPTEEPEIVDMSTNDLNYARCIGRIRYQQLLCKEFDESPSGMELILKHQFYHMVGLWYDSDQEMIKNNMSNFDYETKLEQLKIEVISILDIIDSRLIKDMKDIEYKEWEDFITPIFLTYKFHLLLSME